VGLTQYWLAAQVCVPHENDAPSDAFFASTPASSGGPPLSGAMHAQLAKMSCHVFEEHE
jgi:hypothetical protein